MSATAGGQLVGVQSQDDQSAGDRVTIDVEDGVRLDGRVRRPAGPATGGVVVCHPHPQMGGSMRHPLVIAVQRAAAEAGLACLRFDLRGVGASTGEWDEGVGERHDVAAATRWLADDLTGAPVVLGGWSFGAAASLHAAAGLDVAGWFGIALPLGRADLGVPPVDEDVLSAVAPRLLVHGTRDDVAPHAPLAALAEATSTRLVSLGADHFFAGQAERVADEVVEFATTAVDGSGTIAEQPT